MPGNTLWFLFGNGMFITPYRCGNICHIFCFLRLGFPIYSLARANTCFFLSAAERAISGGKRRVMMEELLNRVAVNMEAGREPG